MGYNSSIGPFFERKQVSASYLIDGYNGRSPRRWPPRACSTASWSGTTPPTAGPSGRCSRRPPPSGSRSSRAPVGADASQTYHGIHVQFAQGQQEADDLIEHLLRHAGAPKSLSVVSDDHRLQNAARRRQASVLPCGDFLDFLKKKRRLTQAKPPTPEKQDHLSDQETAEWLKEFGDLKDDPELRGLF